MIVIVRDRESIVAQIPIGLVLVTPDNNRQWIKYLNSILIVAGSP